MAALSAANATALMVTHDQSEALALGQQVAVLWQGKLLQVASPQALYRQPLNIELAGFIGDAVLLAGQASAGFVDCAFGKIPLYTPDAEGEVSVLLRPEQIRIHAGHSQRSGLPAVVERVDFYGHDANVHLKLLGDETPLLARTVGHQAWQPGQQVLLEVEGMASSFSLAG